MFLAVATVALLAQTPEIQTAAAQRAGQQGLQETKLKQPNIVVIIADDFGVDMLGAYGEGSETPCTPNIDRLAQTGMLFRNAWANPSCSPTRASTLTGRHGFRTGIGTPGMGPTLSLSEVTLPEMLIGYTSSAIGKWHLSGNSSATHPNDSGFDHFSGALGGLVNNYYLWPKVVDGQQSMSTTYATIDTTNEAISAIAVMPEPWFAWVSYNAPHSPYQEPPNDLCATSDCPEAWCNNLPANPTNRDLGHAMTEAMDSEIGRLLDVLDAVDPDAWVIFMGDNGTAAQLSQQPFTPMHAKGTVYEGGLNVPLIVKGPGVVAAECAGLVSCVDLFATFAQLAGSTASSEDSVSMVPYFRNPRQSIRETVYSETFSPNGSIQPNTDHQRAIRDERYKLIRRSGESDEFFDLWNDPFETADLLPNLTTEEQTAFDGLVAELVLLGVD